MAVVILLDKTGPTKEPRPPGSTKIIFVDCTAVEHSVRRGVVDAIMSPLPELTTHTTK